MTRRSWTVVGSLVLGALSGGCFGATGDRRPADVIYVGSNIVTLEPARSDGGAVAIRDGRIAAVGPVSEVSSWRGDATEMVHLGSRALLPAFVAGARRQDPPGTGDLVASPTSPASWVAILAVRATRHARGPDDAQHLPARSIRAAIRSMTTGAFVADRRPPLQVGAPADLVILDRNPLEVSLAELWNLQVLELIRSGRTVFTADPTVPVETANPDELASETRSTAPPVQALVGELAFLGDRLWFTDCATRDRLPVRFAEGAEGLQLALQRLGPTPVRPLLVVVEGRIRPAPPREGDGPVDILRMTSVVEVGGDTGCGGL